MPKVSVIVPIYNTENYLRKCLDSILAQDFDDYEVLLVNDGSKDDSESICKAFAEKDSRFKYLIKENGGLSDARNYGIKRAEGDWLSFIDSDDYVDSNFLSSLLTSAEENDAEISVCGFYKEFGNRTEIEAVSEKQVLDQKSLWYNLLTSEAVGNYACNKLFKRNLFSEIEFPLGKKYEDLYTFYRLASLCSKVVVISQPLYHYIYRTSSISNDFSPKNAADLLTGCEELTSYILSCYPELSEKAVCYMLIKHIHVLNDLIKSGEGTGCNAFKNSLSYLKKHQSYSLMLPEKEKISFVCLSSFTQPYAFALRFLRKYFKRR